MSNGEALVRAIMSQRHRLRITEGQRRVILERLERALATDDDYPTEGSSVSLGRWDGDPADLPPSPRKRTGEAPQA